MTKRVNWKRRALEAEGLVAALESALEAERSERARIVDRIPDCVATAVTKVFVTAGLFKAVKEEP